MHTHDLDPVALVAGLLFAFAGLAVVANRLWDEVNVTAITGAGVALAGLVLAGAIVSRHLTADHN